MNTSTAATMHVRSGLEVALDMVGPLDSGPALPRILERTCATVDAHRATLLRVEEEGVVVEGGHDVDGRPVLDGWRGDVGDQPLLRRARDAGHLVIGDTSPRPEHLPHEVDEALREVRHTVILPVGPLPSADGFLVVMRRHPRPFLDEDVTTVRLFGNVALLAVRNSRLLTDAQEASRAMAGFLNLVVHDLRAPLAVISGYVDLLRSGTLGEPPAAWRRPMELVAAKLIETHRLVDDILLAARLESGAVPTTVETLDLNDVIRRAVTRSEARAILTGVRIESTTQPHPVLARGDRVHVDRIVDNLINNAISYAGDAPWVLLTVDPSQPPAVRVHDGGVGISAELHDRVFDRFFRVDNVVPGTGFGLHLGRVLAEACGGTLHVERSTPGEGSVFRLELPDASSA